MRDEKEGWERGPISKRGAEERMGSKDSHCDNHSDSHGDSQSDSHGDSQR